MDKKHGSWKDIQKLSSKYKVMVDIVLNHGSRKSKWFKNFQRNKGVGNNFYISLNKRINTSNVVRARSHKLLQKLILIKELSMYGVHLVLIKLILITEIRSAFNVSKNN